MGKKIKLLIKKESFENEISNKNIFKTYSNNDLTLEMILT